MVVQKFVIHCTPTAPTLDNIGLVSLLYFSPSAINQSNVNIRHYYMQFKRINPKNIILYWKIIVQNVIEQGGVTPTPLDQKLFDEVG